MAGINNGNDGQASSKIAIANSPVPAPAIDPAQELFKIMYHSISFLSFVILFFYGVNSVLFANLIELHGPIAVVLDAALLRKFAVFVMRLLFLVRKRYF